MAAPIENVRRLLLPNISRMLHIFNRIQAFHSVRKIKWETGHHQECFPAICMQRISQKRLIHKSSSRPASTFCLMRRICQCVVIKIKGSGTALHQIRFLCTQVAGRRLVLGIESSCDDTGAAVVDGCGTVLGEALNSQTETHVEEGGIIPTVAKDLHQKHIAQVVTDALEEARVTLQAISAIAVTNRPGLPPSLLVGLTYAKSLVQQSGKPLIPIHHMEAHALTARMMYKVEFPFLVLLISGGHCLLAVVRGVDDFLLIGKGIDDAPGEAFDKTARRLNLKQLVLCSGLSGGRSIEIMAEGGDPKAFDIHHVMAKHANCNFSFAGLKTRYDQIIKDQEEQYGVEKAAVLPNVADVCASFQYAVLNHLAKRLQRAFVFCEIKELLPEFKTLVISGGVASNSFIRQGLEKMCSDYDCQLVCPPPKLCTDNGIMIAWNGMERLKAGLGFADDVASVNIHGN